MIEQLGCVHIFFTLSAAETHWPDLHRLIGEVCAIETGRLPLDITTLAPEQPQRWRVANVNDYPQICASFLYYRFKLFLDTIKKISSVGLHISTIGAGLNGSSGDRDISMEFYGSRTGPR